MHRNGNFIQLLGANDDQLCSFWGFQFLDRTIEARWRKKDWAFIMTTKIYKNGEGLQPAKDLETSSKCIQQASHECVDILCDTTQLISMGTWRTTGRKSHRPYKTSVSIETPKVCVVPCCACYCMLLYLIVLLLVVIIVSVAFCYSLPFNFRQTHRLINVVFSLRLVVSCHWCWCRCGCGSSHSSTMTMSTSSVVLAETVPASVAGDGLQLRLCFWLLFGTTSGPHCEFVAPDGWAAATLQQHPRCWEKNWELNLQLLV